MKPKEFTRIKNALLPHLPGFVADRKKLFISPVDDFWRGLCFESSQDANRFYLWVFFLPLFVPHDFFAFTYGNRLRRRSGGEGWRDDDPNVIAELLDTIHSAAMPFLDSVSSLEKVVDYMKEYNKRGSRGPGSHQLEAYAYMLIKRGDYTSALESVAELKQSLEGNTVPWVVAQRGRALLMEEKLLQSPEAALAQLEEWKKWTIGKLKLEKFQ